MPKPFCSHAKRTHYSYFFASIIFIFTNEQVNSLLKRQPACSFIFEANIPTIGRTYPMAMLHLEKIYGENLACARMTLGAINLQSYKRDEIMKKNRDPEEKFERLARDAPEGASAAKRF